MLERVDGKVPKVALRRAIAERLGWRVVREDYKQGNSCWRVFNPSGVAMFDWQHLSEIDRDVPQFDSDIGAAMGLLDHIDPHGWVLTGFEVHVEGKRTAYSGDQLPLAICCVMLAYWGIDNLTVEDVAT